MYQLNLIRHGPKNNDPSLHLIPGAATLDEKADAAIRDYIKQFAKSLPSNATIGLYTTIVKRAMQTADIAHDEFNRLGFSVSSPQVDSIGSYVNDNGTERNLSSHLMSLEWQKGKDAEWKAGTYARGINKEDLPMMLWCEKGFDNPQYSGLNLPDYDSGISLREIAARVGDYILQRITNQKGKDADLVIQHSGDIEPWLILTLAMISGHDSTQPGYMQRMLPKIGGGLNPLTGIKIIDTGSDLYLEHPTQNGTSSFPLPGAILLEQSEWTNTNGIADKVIEQRRAV